MVDLWATCRRFGSDKAPALPCGGGIGEQPAALMQAFDILDGAARERVS